MMATPSTITTFLLFQFHCLTCISHTHPIIQTHAAKSDDDESQKPLKSSSDTQRISKPKIKQKTFLGTFACVVESSPDFVCRNGNGKSLIDSIARPFNRVNRLAAMCSHV